MLATLLVICVGVVLYTYVAFPLLLAVRSALRPRPVALADITPRVSVIIAAHDEGTVIAEKLESVLTVDYPSELLEVIVASDGSTDDTERVVSGYADRGVRLLSLARVGKATAINRAVAVSSGEVLVFTDANSILDVRSLRELVRPLADPAVGGVAGDQRYVRSSDADPLADSEQRYWSYDRFIKSASSGGGSVTSATGALYAIRRPLFEPVPDGVTDDFYVSTGVIASGSRLVFAPAAVAREHVAPRGGLEYARKVRVMTRGLHAVRLRRALLAPHRHGFYAVQLFTHKVLRRTMAVPLVVLTVVPLVGWGASPVYRYLASAQLAFYASAAVGGALTALGVRRARLLRLPTYFCLVNAASLVALWNTVRGTRIDRWDVEERVGAHDGDGSLALSHEVDA